MRDDEMVEIIDQLKAGERRLITGKQLRGIADQWFPRVFDSMADAVAAAGVYGFTGVSITDEKVGGLFNVVRETGDEVVDGGTVIRSTSDSRYLLKRVFPNGEVNPLWFGADPTGVADSRNAFQAAFNAARRIKGSVILPWGNYRIVQAAPIVMGAPFLGRGGKLWNSLPTNYLNPNTTETYEATGVLDENGSLIDWEYSSSWSGPWNGKGDMFTVLEAGKIEGILIDGGWGTTGAPSGVRTIRGVRDDGDEFTYYRMFVDSRNTKISGCRFENCPGCYIASGNDIILADNFFGEYGDHVFYVGQNLSGSQRNYTITGNNIVVSRAQSGSLGSTSYIGSSKRAAIKFRGTSGANCNGNFVFDRKATKLMIGFHLEGGSATQPGHCEKINITGNEFDGDQFAAIYTSRSTTAIPAEPTGYKVRNCTIASNHINSSSYPFLIQAALDTVKITGNLVAECNLFMSACGDFRYAEGIKKLSVTGNTVTQKAGSGQPAFAVGGKVTDMFIVGNNFHNLSTSERVFFSPSPYAATEGLAGASALVLIGSLVIEDNFIENYNMYFGDDGYAAYNSGNSYPFTSWVMDDGTFTAPSVVKSGGTLYVNNATVPAGEAPPSSKWSTYTRPATKTRIRMINNERVSNLAASSPYNSYYHVYDAGGVRKLDYLLTSRDNENWNTLGEAVSYNIGAGFEININPFEVNGVKRVAPAAAGTNGQKLTTNGAAGVESWT